jgi:aminomethyltransferase
MKTTPLHEQHLQLGAKMGEFAGYDMPLYYDEGVMAEHLWVRKHAGIFDVSHMRQIVISGAGALSFVETITPSSYGKVPHGRAKYSVMTNEKGGIVDDLIVTKLADDKFFAVVNAGCRDKDLEWMQSHKPDDVTIECLDDRGLIALQGPDSEQVLRDVFHVDTEGMPYMWFLEANILGEKAFISRLGYTGEDGYEISVPDHITPAVWTHLLGHGAVKPIGLAARDSLRLEMGYCLYTHDITDETDPVSGNVGWVIGKGNESFIGADIVRPIMEQGAEKLRVGVKLTDKGVAREGALIMNEAGEQIGVLTSGGFGPSLQQAIGQGYVPRDYAAAGTKIFVNVRGRNIDAEIADMPFMPAKTKSMKTQQAA